MRPTLGEIVGPVSALGTGLDCNTPVREGRRAGITTPLPQVQSVGSTRREGRARQGRTHIGHYCRHYIGHKEAPWPSRNPCCDHYITGPTMKLILQSALAPSVCRGGDATAIVACMLCAQGLDWRRRQSIRSPSRDQGMLVDRSTLSSNCRSKPFISYS